MSRSWSVSGDEPAFVSEEEGLFVSDLKQPFAQTAWLPALPAKKLVCDGKNVEDDEEAPADLQL